MSFLRRGRLFVFDFHDGLAVVRPALGADVMSDMIRAARLALDEMLQGDDILRLALGAAAARVAFLR